MFVVFQPNGFWDVYRTSDGAFLKHLSGPAGDCEFQWDVHDPNAALFLPINGGSVFRKMDVAANTSSVYWDFTAAAHALFPNATRYWTKSEGSPSIDGRYWGLMAEADNFGGVYGFVKVDVVAKTIVWSMPNPNGYDRSRQRHNLASGRWFVVSGLTPVGTKAYATDGSGTVRTLHPSVEHAEIGTLPNGHDFIITENYQADGGPIFAIDIDTGQTLPFVLNIYNNPLFDNPQGQCVNCAVWPSARATSKPRLGHHQHDRARGVERVPRERSHQSALRRDRHLQRPPRLLGRGALHREPRPVADALHDELSAHARQ
jgi:hypothetical protein